MKRAIFFIFFTGLSVIAGAKTVWASEGTAVLGGSGSSAQCFLASVLVDEGDYQLVMTCRNLLVPPETETLFYYAWAKRAGAAAQEGERRGLAGLGRGAFISLGDITGGKLAGSTREAFDEVLVTAETTSRPRQPNLNQIIISGLVRPIAFDEKEVVPQPSPTEELGRITVTPTPQPTPVEKEAGRSVASTAFRVFLGLLVIIVVFAVVVSLLQRRSARK